MRGRQSGPALGRVGGLADPRKSFEIRRGGKQLNKECRLKVRRKMSIARRDAPNIPVDIPRWRMGNTCQSDARLELPGRASKTL